MKLKGFTKICKEISAWIIKLSVSVGENVHYLRPFYLHFDISCDFVFISLYLSQYFADYLEICNVMRDDTGKAQACHALADAYHS